MAAACVAAISRSSNAPSPGHTCLLSRACLCGLALTPSACLLCGRQAGKKQRDGGSSSSSGAGGYGSLHDPLDRQLALLGLRVKNITAGWRCDTAAAHHWLTGLLYWSLQYRPGCRLQPVDLGVVNMSVCMSRMCSCSFGPGTLLVLPEFGLHHVPQ